MSTIDISTNAIAIPRDRLDEAADVLARAFEHYPVMRYVFADQDAAYQRVLQALFRFSCETRLVRGWPLLGSVHAQDLVGVAGVNGFEEAEQSDLLTALSEQFEAFIGPRASERFARFGAVTEAYRPDQPHLYLGVLGVHPDAQGQGHGRALLDAVHTLAEAHPTATGVALDTELLTNVRLYEHAGYHVTGHARLDDLDIWSMFRPNGAGNGLG